MTSLENTSLRTQLVEICSTKEHRKLYHMAWKIVKCSDTANSMVSDAIIKALARGQFDGNSKLSTYLGRAVINASLDHVRSHGVKLKSRKAPSECESSWGPSDVTPSYTHTNPERVFLTKEKSLLLAKALRDGVISDSERRCLMLHAVDGFKYREIAHHEQVAIGTVMSRISSARAKLRKACMN